MPKKGRAVKFSEHHKKLKASFVILQTLKPIWREKICGKNANTLYSDKYEDFLTVVMDK